jgi:hypothetical protein
MYYELLTYNFQDSRQEHNERVKNTIFVKLIISRKKNDQKVQKFRRLGKKLIPSSLLRRSLKISSKIMKPKIFHLKIWIKKILAEKNLATINK